MTMRAPRHQRFCCLGIVHHFPGLRLEVPEAESSALEQGHSNSTVVLSISYGKRTATPHHVPSSCTINPAPVPAPRVISWWLCTINRAPGARCHSA